MKENAKQIFYFFTLIGLLAFYLVHRIQKIYTPLSGPYPTKLNTSFGLIGEALTNQSKDFLFATQSLQAGGIAFFVCLMVGLYVFVNQKNCRHGKEHGAVR